MDDDGQQEDEQSLFGGSLPSSPIMRGRSLSPALALPGTGGIATIMPCTRQNVGTIALPGSQLDIELLVNPLALSSSSSPRPPAQDHAASMSPFTSRSVTPSTEPGNSKRRAGKSSLKRKASMMYQRPTPPAIPLPDPSGPIPANFFRNQTALLGTAGLVGGVRAAKVPPQNIGSATNPINVDDDTPRTLPRFMPQFIARTQPAASSGFPPPSNSQIVNALIKDQEVMPLLLEIMKQAALEKIGKKQPVSEDEHIPIPAGAADWNIQDQMAYDPTRFRYLVSQLMRLIRTATRKAAIRNYWLVMKKAERLLKQKGLDGAGEGSGKDHYPSANYGTTHTPSPLATSIPVPTDSDPPLPPAPQPCDLLPQTTPNNVLVDVSNEARVAHPQPKSDSCHAHTPIAPHHGLSSSFPHPAPDPLVDTSSQPNVLDELVGSLLTAAPDNSGPSLEAILSGFSSQQSTPDVEQWLMNTWMPIFESLPGASEDFGNLDVGMLESSPMPDFPMDFDFGHMFDQQPAGGNVWDPPSDTTASHVPDGTVNNEHSNLGSLDSFNFGQQPTVFASQGLTTDASFINSTSHLPEWDGCIDPMLMSHTPPQIARVPHPIVSANAASSQPPHLNTDFSRSLSLMASPIPSMSSMSSFGEVELLTPTSSTWELPEVPVVVSAPGPNQAEGGIEKARPTQDVMKIAKEAERSANVGEVLPALISALFPVGAKKVKVTQPIPVGPIATKKLSRAEILVEVRKRRKLLAEANIKARTKLWEITIEHAVLAQISQQNKS